MLLHCAQCICTQPWGNDTGGGQYPVPEPSVSITSKQLRGLGMSCPLCPSWEQAHLSLESTGTSRQPPSLSHSLAARRISSLEAVFMRKCQGTQANVCISIPGITSSFPHSSQTHKCPGSKQWPVSPKQPTAWMRACIHCLVSEGACVLSPYPLVDGPPYGFLVPPGDPCFSNASTNTAVQRETQWDSQRGVKLKKA